MTAWLVAVVLLVPPFAIAIAVAMLERANHRLAAVQLAGAFASLVLVAMTFAFDQPSFVDIALGLTMLSVPGTLLFTMFMERWL